MPPNNDRPSRPEELREVIEAIHAGPARHVWAITGGGSRAISDLLEIPGGSKVLLEAVVPYSSAALCDWLRAAPEHFCSERTACAMAMVAYQRAQLLRGQSDSAGVEFPIGIGCTASLVSDRPKKGPHRMHVAWQSDSHTVVHTLELTKGARDRQGEERLAAAMILNAAAEGAGTEKRVSLPLSAGEALIVERGLAPEHRRALLAGTIHAQGEHRATGDRADGRPRVLFPGAFNPLHAGHRRMAKIAEKLLHRPVEFEISILNVDKPPLDFLEMDRRAKQFLADDHLWFTRAPTFAEKADIFPGGTFVVGIDTLVRIAEPRYYGGEQGLAAALEHLAQRESRFLVFGRMYRGKFQTLREISLPEKLRQRCREVTAEQFREDISSTELRRAGGE